MDCYKQSLNHTFLVEITAKVWYNGLALEEGQLLRSFLSLEESPGSIRQGVQCKLERVTASQSNRDEFDLSLKLKSR
jgi:hypothetical protein